MNPSTRSDATILWIGRDIVLPHVTSRYMVARFGSAAAAATVGLEVVQTPYGRRSTEPLFPDGFSKFRNQA